MKESATYQAILQEGEARGEVRGEARGRMEEARELLLLIGSQQLGDPDAATQAALASILEVAQLKALCARVLDVESWSELLG